VQVKVFWHVMLCIVAIGYQCFGGLLCLHLQGSSKHVILLQHYTAHSPEDLNLNLHHYENSKPAVP